VVVGSYGVGLTLTLDRCPDAGETVVGKTFDGGHGGKGSNQAIGAARLGASVVLCSVVGTDHYADSARTLWHTEGVDASMVDSLAGSTMVGVILVEPSGENRIAIVPGVLDDFTADRLNRLAEVLASADVLIVGLEIPTATAHEALRIGREAGVITVLNPAPVPTDALPDGMLGLVDHVTPNRTEAARLAGLPASTDAHRLITAQCFDDVGTVVLTLGADGALVRDGAGIHRIHAVQVPVVDTTGAGDAFNAAYAVRLAAGDSARDAAAFAVRAAAFSVTRAQVIPSLPYLADVNSLDTASTTRPTASSVR
jgi:ribokinase